MQEQAPQYQKRKSPGYWYWSFARFSTLAFNIGKGLVKEVSRSFLFFLQGYCKQDMNLVKVSFILVSLVTVHWHEQNTMATMWKYHWSFTDSSCRWPDAISPYSCQLCWFWAKLNIYQILKLDFPTLLNCKNHTKIWALPMVPIPNGTAFGGSPAQFSSIWNETICKDMLLQDCEFSSCQYEKETLVAIRIKHVHNNSDSV